MISQDELRYLAQLVDNACVSLFSAVKYIYSISDKDFYNVNVKDIFKVGLNDITRTDSFANLGLRFDERRIGEMSSPDFAEVLGVLRYSFAVRLPFIRRMMQDCPLKDGHFRDAFNMIAEFGFANPDGIVELDFKTAMWMVKSRKPEPNYDTDWFKRWIYTYGKELSAINNRNMFMLGCVDALFPLYYAALQEKLVQALQGWY